MVTTYVGRRRFLQIPLKCQRLLSHIKNTVGTPGFPWEAGAHNLPKEKSFPPHSLIFSPRILTQDEKYNNNKNTKIHNTQCTNTIIQKRNPFHSPILSLGTKELCLPKINIFWTFPRCGMVGFPSLPGSVILHLDYLSLSLNLINLMWNIVQLNFNLNFSMSKSYI